MMVSDPSRLIQRKVRKVVFKKRRFPKQTEQATEMKIIREWINYALEKKSLTVDDENAAFNFVSAIFNSYRCIGGTNGYIGYSLQTPENRRTSSIRSRVPNAPLVRDGCVEKNIFPCRTSRTSKKGSVCSSIVSVLQELTLLLLCKIADQDVDFRLDYFAAVFLKNLRANGA